MKKIIFLGLLFSQISTAGTFTVNSKVLKVMNIGSVAQPIAVAEIVYKTILRTSNHYSEEGIIINVVADGSSHVFTKNSSDVTVRVIDQMIFGNNIKGTLFKINIKKHDVTSYHEHSSVVLLKEDGEVKIID